MSKLYGKIRLRPIFGIWLVFLMFALSACGGKDKARTGGEYFVLESQKEECLLLGDDLQGVLLSAQYHEGEIIQFWSVPREVDGKRGLDIYLCRQGAERELIFENVDTSFAGQWFLDNDGNYYIVNRKEIVKVDQRGNLFFRTDTSDGAVTDICQLPDGRAYLLKYDARGLICLCSLDTSTGEIAAIDRVNVGEGNNQRIAAGENGLLLLNENGLWSIDVETWEAANRMDYPEYDYEPNDDICDFRLVAENAAEILWPGALETIRVTDIGASRTIITARCRQFFDEELMKRSIWLFNQSNDTYYVVVETVEDDDDYLDFLTRTNLELGTGGGPDIIFADAVYETESLLEKGAFVDLRPYIEASGMKEDDYFSAAFDFWKVGDSIYAANMVARPTGIWISEDLLGSREAPDIEALLDAMLGYEEKAIFHIAWESDQVLEYFLSGSETLWGMVDWEKGTCDFSGELFARMLEAAKRYGFDRTENHPYVAYPISVGFYTYETREQMISEGKVPVGYIFEDGCYPRLNQSGLITINSNSDKEHRQGAWEYIAFLLSDEMQASLKNNMFPVSKAVFEAKAKQEMEEGAVTAVTTTDGRTSWSAKSHQDDFRAMNYDVEAFRAVYDLTEEKTAEIRTLLETSRALPVRTVPLIALISEEASAYFYGSKSIEDVVPVIQNRVQLYLDQN